MFEEFHHTTIGDLLATPAGRFAGQVYLQAGDQSLTYAEADRQSSALAAGLAGLGLAAGDRLAVILPNIPAFVITVYAAAKAGLILVPINVRRTQAEVLARLSKTRPKALLTTSQPTRPDGPDHLSMALDLRAQLPGLDHVIALDSAKQGAVLWYSLLASSTLPGISAPQPDDPAAIIHSLGNLGEPRGALLTHQGLVRNAAAIAAQLGASSDDVFLGAVPFSNAFGLTATILASAVTGARLVCLPDYHPAQAQAAIRQHKVTVYGGVPTMFAMELNHPDFDASAYNSLRVGLMAGAPCPPELMTRAQEQMGCKLLIGYGLTEASPAVTMTRLDDGPLTATQTVGRPLEDIEIMVADSEGTALPEGAEGELRVRGYNVMRGYWDDPQGTAEVLTPAGWLCTGDLAIIDPDGPVRLVGRTSEVIIRSGFKIFPGMIEMALRTHPGVRECAVVGVPDLIYGERIFGCVVRKPGAAFTNADLLTYASSQLPDYAIPDRILFFDALPRHGSGPVQKAYLRERVRIRGHAWKFGKNIDTDAIIPARRCNTADPRELALYCMEDADPKFVGKMRRGDLIVADTNFGCGSSREVAPLAIKAAGVSSVIAKSFARIFFRNAINIGLPILECPQAVDGIQEGDEVEVEPATGMIRNLTRGESYQAEPFPDFLQRIIDRGGLLAYVEDRLALQTSEGAK